ncbi:hypothetical protein MYX06_04910 [Patescibacteria group bacterium AH-259-L05]|nr:hypothetical protein [Patescibacteria group bacterium AH-259-L05]
MSTKAGTIFSRLENLEKDIQKLKVDMFFALPKAQQKSLYPKERLLQVIRSTRKSIWKELSS